MLKRFVAFLRGINIGGKNKINMADLNMDLKNFHLMKLRHI